ncbi:NAD(P)-dependent oxidoreductase [Enterococcus sp. CSURQ0835]|uniref:NAD(P)-dependent oxidoreductase n=1 Tax=Enterococcus sp. CSURQ0835 TaxID=2681394 RepID=UPI0013591826|nr:NAD(P)-binding domain-containing protein [Enterococcus sp. CSURQ0835]
MKITFIGLGDMGSPLVTHLIKADHQVTIWDRDAEKMAQVKEKYPTVSVAISLKEAVEASHVIFTSVMSDDVLALHIGNQQNSGITDFICEDTILVITSTLDPKKISDIQQQMPAKTYLLDATMIGGVKYARNAEIVFIVGGNEQAFKRVEPLLSLMGTVEYAGKLGNGAKLKLITNDAIMAAEAGIRETLDLADAYGIDYDITLKLLAMGPLKAVVLRALDETNPRPLKDSVADVDELVQATDHLADLSLVKSARQRLQQAVDATDGEAKFIDITNKKTALPAYRQQE